MLSGKTILNFRDNSFNFVYLWICLSFLAVGTSLHLEGTWNPTQGYRFLAKFGFQRTQIDELEASWGYVYGNVQLAHQSAIDGNSTTLGTLVLVGSEFILGLYANATEPMWIKNASDLSREENVWLVETERCRRMFSQIDAIAWHRSCAPNGKMDLLRSLPCPENGLCSEEDDAGRVLKPFQFTYTIQDLRQPRYWYLSLVACTRNPTTCQWETTAVPAPGTKTSSKQSKTMAYSIWLVNGAPRLQGFNKFEHQFSFEMHDTAEMYLVFMVLYLVLSIVAHIYLPMRRSPHTSLYLVSMWLATLGALMTSIHLVAFSSDGRGLGRVSVCGTLLSQWSDALFLVLLLSTAQMGFMAEWQSGNSQSRQRSGWPYLSGMVALFVTVNSFMYIWAQLDEDPVIDFSVWNTIPGCMLLVFRFGVAFWFLAILRHRKLLFDECPDGLTSGALLLGPGVDLVQFAAVFLLWILVLPLTVFMSEICMSSLWRTKTIISICSSANFVAACVYGCFMWRCRSYSEQSY